MFRQVIALHSKQQAMGALRVVLKEQRNSIEPFGRKPRTTLFLVTTSNLNINHHRDQCSFGSATVFRFVAVKQMKNNSPIEIASCK